MRIIAPILVSSIALMMAACSMQSGPSARVRVDPPEIKVTDDSVEAYAAAAKDSATFEGFQGIYEHFLKAYPQSTELHRDYQAMFDSFEKEKVKTEYYKKLSDENPNSAMYAYLYGRTLTGDESGNQFRRAIELDDDYFWGHLGLGSHLISKVPPDTNASMAEYLRAIKIDNSFPGAFQMLVNVYLAREDFTQALKMAELFRTTSPDDQRTVKLISDVHLKKGDAVSAESVLVNFAQAHPEDIRTRRYLVDFYERQGDYGQALVFQREWLKLEKNPGDVMFAMAKTFAKGQQYDSSLTYLGMAVENGFGDYRRFLHNPVLDPIRTLPGYDTIAVNLRNIADMNKKARLEAMKDDLEKLKEDALSERLETPAPEFSLVNLRGETVSLADLRGKVVVIDFWATWCGPCRLTMPLLQDYVDQGNDGVEFLSVDVWENDTSLVRPFLADQGYSFNVLFGSKETTDQFGVNAIPTLFVIDREGIIRYRHLGSSPHADLMVAWQTESLLGPGL